MGRFEIMEHTADVGVIATGDTLADALSWAAKGMISVIVELDSVEPLESVELSVTATDTESLVVDWLNEVLYRHEVDEFLPKNFIVTVDEAGKSLHACCTGEKIDPRRHDLMTSVKAATYHGLEVSHNGEWSVQVVLDV